MTRNNGAMRVAPSLTTLPLRILACGRCGMAFTCGTGGHGGGCWCMDEATRLPMPDGAEDDCLCPTCLRAVTAPATAGRPA